MSSNDAPASDRTEPHGSEFDLAPITTTVTLPPRFARRLRCVAADSGITAERAAFGFLTRALVPDARDRRRLVERDLDDAAVRRP